MARSGVTSFGRRSWTMPWSVRSNVTRCCERDCSGCGRCPESVRSPQLTWALEIGDVSRFRSIKLAISYCGLCGAEKSSADKMLRTPISKQRNKHIQHVLVEAAKLAPKAVPLSWL